MKKFFAIVLTAVLAANVFASKKMGAGLGYKVCANKEGIIFDLLGWWLNGIAYPSQPIAMIMGSWGAEDGARFGCGLGYKVCADKEGIIFDLLGWWLNAVVYPSQPIAMIIGSWGAEEMALNNVESNLNIALADVQ